MPIGGALVGSARVLLRVDNDKFNRDLRTSGRHFQRTTRDMERQAKRTHSVLGRSFKGLAGILGGVGVGLGLSAGIRSVFQEMLEGQKVAAQTDAVLKSTGGVANVTAKHVGVLADQLLRKTGIDDEAIKSTENLLLTFTKIRNETGKGNDIFDQATKATVDLSVALDQDLKSSAIQVGKALNDPEKGLTALRRVGVAFTNDQQKLVKHLVKTGQTLKAQKLILAELNKEFGGSAAARGRTLAGQWSALREEAKNLGAELARGVLPQLRQAVIWLRRQLNMFRQNRGQAGQLRRTLTGVARNLRSIAVFANRVAKAFGGWVPVLKALAIFLLIRRMLLLASAVRAVGAAAFFAASGFGAMGATAAGGAGGGAAGKAKGKVPLIGLNLPTVVGAAVLSIPGAGGARKGPDELQRKYPLLYELVQRAGRGAPTDDEEQAILATLDQKRSLSQQPAARLARAEGLLRKLYASRRGGMSDAASRGGAVAAGRGRAPRRPPSRNPAVANAQAERQAVRAAHKVEDKEDEREEKRRQREREKRAAERERREHRAMAARARVVDQTQQHRWRLLRADARRKNIARATQASASEREREARAMQFEFLTGMQGALNEFGSNIWAAPSVGGGQTATHTWAMVNLLREQNLLIRSMTRTMHHPGAKHARTELAAHFGGF
jgi:hypothetical protein